MGRLWRQLFEPLDIGLEFATDTGRYRAGNYLTCPNCSDRCTEMPERPLARNIAARYAFVLFSDGESLKEQSARNGDLYAKPIRTVQASHCDDRDDVNGVAACAA